MGIFFPCLLGFISVFREILEEGFTTRDSHEIEFIRARWEIFHLLPSIFWILWGSLNDRSGFMD